MAGSAKIRIEGEDATAAAWASAMGRAKGAASQMAGVWRSAFAGISFAGITKIGLDAIKLGDDLNKAAVKAGIGGKAMSELAYAAKLADVELVGLSTGIKKMQVALSLAGSGAKEPIQALEALGLKLEDIKDLAADKQFELIGDRISKLESPADRARAATELFGKAGADLLPLFEQGAQGIQHAREEAEKLGLSFDDKHLQALSAADDSIKRLSASFEGMATVLVAKLAPSLAWTFDRLAGKPKEINEQIADIEETLNSPSMQRVLGMNGGARRNELQAQLKVLRELSQHQSMVEMGVVGARSPGGDAKPPGFAAVALADTSAKDAAKMEASYRDMISDLNKDIGEISDKTLHDDMERQAKRLDMADEWYEKWHQSEKDLAEYREKQAEEAAQATKDLFNDAFDAMEHDGKISIGNLAKYFLLEFTQKAISNILEQMFTKNGAGGHGYGAAFASAITGAITSRDSGGRGQAGMAYAIGTGAQPEVFVPDSAGSFIPRGMGGISVAPQINIDARGATTESAKLLPQYAKQISDMTVERVITGIKRRKYDIGLRS